MTASVHPRPTVSVVLAGVGGQGILLASEIVAQAAAAAGHQVKTNEVHGMAQRGGSVIAQIRYGAEVHSPVAALGTARVLASLERIEALRHRSYLASDGVAVVSSQAIVPVTVSSGGAEYPADAEDRLRRAFPRLVYLDAVGTASTLGNAKAANLVVLGAVATVLDLPESAWNEAIARCVSAKHLDVNRQAFAAGRQAADQTQGNWRRPEGRASESGGAGL